MQKSKIKICGITRARDAKCAVKSRAWAIGYIFVKESKRFITPESAGQISNQISDVEKVGVFVNSSIKEILATMKIADLSIIQLHGDETPEFCKQVKEQSGLFIIKALRVKAIEDLAKINEFKDLVFAILLDTYSAKEYGGTGEVFDWDIAAKAKDFGVPIILAGGINPENIKEAYNKVEPFAFDISSGVESQKGIKDENKIRRLFEEIND